MSVDLVLIGRNEGERLVRALNAAVGQAERIVYVDSGSTDGSVAAARDAGAQVVELDMSMPFSAARARNAGFEHLASGSAPVYVQFIDGDCALEPGWINEASQALDRDPNLGVVTGWRSEVNRNTSVYNQMCDFEWHRPAGPIEGCGGDMCVRAEAFSAVGGFDPQAIAGEDEEFCLRIAKAGWKLERLPLAMTRHDANITRFSQWWRRAVRTGHAYTHVADLHPGHYRRERLRILAYGLVLPLIAVVGSFVTFWLPAGVLALYGLSYWKTAQGLRSNGLPDDECYRHAVFLTISKFPNLLGMFKYWRTRRSGDLHQIIEYK